MRIRVIGLPRSGTTWMEFLVENNINTPVTHWAKHKLPEDIGVNHDFEQSQCALAVIVRKRLDHWLGSCVRAKGIIGRQRYPKILVDEHTLRADIYSMAQLHQEFHNQWTDWLTAGGYKFLVVEYADLLRDPRGTTQAVARAAGATMTEKFTRGPKMRGDDAKVAYYLGEDPWGQTPQNEIGKMVDYG